MKRDDFDSNGMVKEYFGDSSPGNGIRRFHVKEGYMAKLVDPAPFADFDVIDIIEWDEEYGDTIEFRTVTGNAYRVDVWDSFELVVFEVTERIRFLKGEG